MNGGRDELEARADDDRLAELLVEFDAALKEGTPPDAPAALPEVPAASQSQLLRARACLRMLEEAWPRKRQSPAVVQAAPAATAGGKKMLGRFELRRELGRGGFGVVHLAYDPRLGREVALKVPHAQVYADPDLHSRFQREARAAAGLDHPNIVPVYEAGEVDSVGYIALAYCPGITLHDWLRRRIDSVPGPAIAEFMATLASAIHHAHEQGTIHRDLKPANVLLGGDWADEPGYAHQPPSLSSFSPKITDFGLAKRLDSQITQTHTGTIAGTPCYMAPEQTGRATSPITPATDVYSLGAILYELLTGRAPFLGETVLDTLDQVRNLDPIPPRRLRPGIPRDLEIICLKCLEKDPSRRYASAQALAEDLRRYQSGHSIVARPTGPISQVAKWARRRPAVAALVAVSALAVVVLIGSDIYIRQKNRETQRALKGEVEARGHLTTALAGERLMLYYHRIRLTQAALAENNVRQAENYLTACVPAAGERDQRGWEWRYLQRLTHSELRWFREHDRSVSDVALSEDGQRAVSVSSDGQTKCWDTSSGQVLWTTTLSARDGTRASLAFGGTLVAVGDISQNIVTVHSADDGRELHRLPGCFCTFSRDGTELATVDEPPQQVRVFDPRSGSQLRSHLLDKTKHAAVALAAGQTIVTTVATDHTLRLQLLPDGPQFVLRGLTAAPTCVSLDEDGDFVAAGSHEGVLRVWDARDGRQLLDVRAHLGHVRAIQFRPIGKEIATADSLGAIKIWNLNGHLLYSLPGHGYFINSLVYSADGRRLASASSDRSVKVWDASRDPQGIVLRGHETFIHTIAFDPQSGQLASGGFDGFVYVWDAVTGQLRTKITASAVNTRQLAFTSAGGELVGADGNGRISAWEPASGKLLRTWPPHSPRQIRHTALGRHGQLLAAETADRMGIVIRDTATGKDLLTLAHPGQVRTLAFSPNGNQLAIAAGDHVIQLWDTTTGQFLHSLKGHDDDVRCLAFSWDGKRLASGGNDQFVRLWDVASGTQSMEIRNQWGRSNLYALAFSPDGKRLAAGRLDATVMLWDAHTGQEVVELPCHRMGVTSLAFAPDGNRLAAVINDGSIVIWDATPTGR